MRGDVAAIVPAAGLGARFGGPTRKPFTAVGKHPLLAHTLRALERSAAVRWIVVVVRPEECARAQRLLVRYRIRKAMLVSPGGASRAGSVARGFAHLPRGARWVLVHDGARPCVSAALIDRTVREAKRWGAAACGLPASLTVKSVDARGWVRATLRRDALWLAQTPQVFRRALFAKALARTRRRWDTFPDDASIVEAAGGRVRMVMGDPLNLKVTTPNDVVLAGAILKEAVR